MVFLQRIDERLPQESYLELLTCLKVDMFRGMSDGCLLSESLEMVVVAVRVKREPERDASATCAGETNLESMAIPNQVMILA